MLLFAISYLGGVLTILSPCILPVLPFVFARADKPFIKSGLPLLLGMAATFALVASIATLGGSWVVQANEYGRYVAIVLLAIFGITLLLPQIADRLTRPLVALGDRLSQSTGQEPSAVSSFVLGIATGLLWAPCAGPILGLLLTGAALQGANVHTSLLLLAYAAGAATSLAVALLIGGRVFTAMKRSLGAGEWIRRGLGVAVLCGVVIIALGLDTGFLTQVSLASTTGLEQSLVNTVKAPPQQSMAAAEPAQPTPPAAASVAPDATAAAATSAPAEPKAAAAEPPLPVEGQMPALTGAVEWINSPPLTKEGLRGKVVLVDFWTYSCINCLRALPYIRAWAEKYKDQGLVVIGVHAPEFAFERKLANVHKAVDDLKIGYPVAVDNDYAIWRAFNNEYWPAHYFFDAQGRQRHHHFGEGNYDESEHVIQRLLAEAGNTNVSSGVVQVDAQGAQAAADKSDVKSPETYIGFDRADNFISPGGFAENKRHIYAAGKQPKLNDWSLTGDWTVSEEQAALDKQNGGIVFRFHARDLHLVLGPGVDKKPVRFRIMIDGASPGANHGMDVDASGRGTVTEERLYQLVRQDGPVEDRTFEIQFLDPGVHAYSFTFG
ncbi:MAG TPA: cytochrome c biogenesis protein DipZ [Magnetospirillaceae bacterium]|jgi:cytochrome c biogenesis protein CcdA/thiol-disulfide isomerase/thioredoxin